MPNSLSRAASPYLRQHQENPVDWVEWGDEAFARAQTENKLVLVSIGYAACHWCHVMAHESFEDPDLAEIMNRHFVCIKVDREERPDVDQIYLEAVQMITGRGGWPLNCFMLPDGRPVYGGTYFRPEQWRDILLKLQELWIRGGTALADQAEQITAHLRKLEGRKWSGSITPVNWPQAVQAFAARFDRERGGTGSAPKFPMPDEWRFLLRYGFIAKDEPVLRQVRLTLDRMAAGGIHDHLAGGFARYSTDGEWKVPHFEKMLYDNAQLLELYAEAYAALGEPAYKDTALAIARFLESELANPLGGYNSALDADSEGEEGLFYAWTRFQVEAVLGDRFAGFEDFLGVDGEGLWEEGRNVLLRRYSLAELAARQGWSQEEAEKNWEQARSDLHMARSERIRPLLDDKVLTSWNGLLIQAFAAGFRHIGEPDFRRRACAIADFLLEKAVRPDGGLWHRGWNGNFSIPGFLEDYAFLANGLIELYQTAFEERYLIAARALAEFVLKHFQDPESPLFFFTGDDAPPLLVRKKEVMDNVVPSSNAVMAEVLLSLSEYFTEPRYREKAEAMLHAIRSEFPVYAPAYARWAGILFQEDHSSATFAVVGSESGLLPATAGRHYLPHLRLAGSALPSELPLLHGKFLAGKNLAFRCEHGACGLPSADWKTLLSKEMTSITQVIP